ncbi:hypothetical protein DPEC_G00321140 [Dallia pectoralis]|uniref:Uncharacterized protein n=1 Tax=Dallia pectoralis TaxID=75939 RepID=A0ACC2FAC7_DALPE|nr:hypothetical protein DPEC_G00321140 [Dallia pectoralis]
MSQFSVLKTIYDAFMEQLRCQKLTLTQMLPPPHAPPPHPSIACITRVSVLSDSPKGGVCATASEQRVTIGGTVGKSLSGVYQQIGDSFCRGKKDLISAHFTVNIAETFVGRGNKSQTRKNSTAT